MKTHAGLTPTARALFAALLLAAGVLVLLAARADAPACRYGPPRRLAALQDARIAEASGIAAGRVNPDVFWVHNDSGDEPRLFAVDRDGRTRAVLLVGEAKAVDWEDVTAGPGPDGRPSLYIADTGNNERKRGDLRVYCIPEPALREGTDELRSEAARVFPFRYPDGAHDAEALMVHPETRRLYVITKDVSGSVGLYRFPRPLRAGDEVTLERAGSVSLPEPSMWGRMVTAADIAPDGRRCVLRTYLSLLEFRAPDGKAFEGAFARAPATIEAPPERQGEAVAYAANGHDLITVGEGRNAPLYLLPCLAR